MRPTRLRPQSEMNITPMIDVLLVLLVIFMASLPLSQKGLDATLPSQTQSPQTPAAPPPEQIVVEYTAERKIAVNKQDVTIAELEGRLRQIFADRRDKTLYVIGDGALRYGEIVEVIDAGKGAGVTRVGIVTERMRGLR